MPALFAAPRRGFILSLLVFLAVATAGARAQSITAQEARTIAKEATIYGFPMVDNYRIQYSYFVDRGGPEYKAPWNTLVNNARVYTPDDKAIQTPNSDTPYSYVGADLRAEPLVFTVPEVESGRYYSLQFIDMYTFDFAYVGSRATGNGAGSYLLVGPGWKGATPKGIKAVIPCETELAFVLYRTQLFGPDDIENVKKVQAGYKIETLSHFLGQAAPPAAPPIAFVQPLTPENEKTSPEFFSILDFLLQFTSTNPTETEMRARFARLGIDANGKFDVKTLTPEMREAVAAGMADAWAAFKDFKATELDTGKKSSADAFGTRAFLNGDYMARMSGAVLGIYGNAKEEAFYPAYFLDADMKPLSGANLYSLHFDAGQLPPVNAFWSLTLYELPASLLSANPINRYLINSPMLPSLKRDADGGLTLHVQHGDPGSDKEPNWLPAPAGPFFLVMRLYWPKEAALDGQWKAPPLVTASADAPASTVLVTPDNFVRAESDFYFAGVGNEGGFGKLLHRREPSAIDNQTVIRLNRDTLYSAAVLDLDAGPVTITLPEVGKRFMSLQVINEDQYTQNVFYGAGVHRLTKEDIGTRYVILAIRTLVDPNDKADIAAVHALQDSIKIEQPGGPGRFEIPAFDPVSQKKVRELLLGLNSTLPDTKGMFGRKEEVDPVRRLIGAAAAWGGNPERDALYLNATPAKNDGKTVYRLKVKDVPVDGFWSISVYNAKGYFEPNALNGYTVNNLTAKPDADGAISVQFGGCDGAIPNCIPTPEGWNYLVRLYRPRAEILSGDWKFPEAKAAE